MSVKSRRHSITLGDEARFPETEDSRAGPSRLRSGTVYSPGAQAKTNSPLTPGKKAILCKYMDHTPYPTYEDYLQLENLIELPIVDLKVSTPYISLFSI